MRSILIHLLGGYTTADINKVSQHSDDQDTRAFFTGQWAALQNIRQFAESINGTAADDWCKVVYNYIIKRISSVEDTLITLDPDTDTDGGDTSPSPSAPFQRLLPLAQTASVSGGSAVAPPHHTINIPLQ